MPLPKREILAALSGCLFLSHVSSIFGTLTLLVFYEPTHVLLHCAKLALSVFSIFVASILWKWKDTDGTRIGTRKRTSEIEREINYSPSTF